MLMSNANVCVCVVTHTSKPNAIQVPEQSSLIQSSCTDSRPCSLYYAVIYILNMCVMFFQCVHFIMNIGALEL